MEVPILVLTSTPENNMGSYGSFYNKGFGDKIFVINSLDGCLSFIQDTGLQICMLFLLN